MTIVPENKNLFSIVDDFFKENPPPFATFDFGDNIPVRKINNARKLYANYSVDKEKPILIIDDTVFSSAKKGILVTNVHIFYRLYIYRGSNKKTIGKIPWDDIKQIYIDIGKQGSDLVVNNQKVAFTLAFGLGGVKEREGKIINRLFNTIIASLH